MEMEVAVAVLAVDFNFDSACSSPYMTAPSSPQRFPNFFSSAPTSPSRASSFYSSIPFNWEEKPGTPKAGNDYREGNRSRNTEDGHGDDTGGDFEFDFSGQLERTSLSADELFDGGKIKPLKPPPGYDSSLSTVSSPRSPRSPRSSRNKKDFDPFQAAMEETRKKELPEQHNQEQSRGRERTLGSSSASSSSSRKGTRSLSPLRVSDIMVENEFQNSHNEKTVASSSASNSSPNKPSSYASSFFSAISFHSQRYKKWKLRDFLLFRSASEGRATSQDPILAKYAVLSKKEAVEDIKNASFRSTDSSVGSSRRRGPPVSAHEMHYTANRAVSEEMRRKTFLPYKQGLLGCLGFNPGVHEISRGIGSLARG